MTFKELQERFEQEEVTQEEFDEIMENEEVKEIENNGVSGQYPNLIWYTVYGHSGEEFDIYG